ncbi:type I restriction endonuclease subunit R [Streptomyces sp. NL15-2K]|uniref:type I restriction endonuclease subunit R n=1 Tax=Streptomyces sp. NL15-2K TaxID=376149 RepID=UPI000FFA25AE|nr:MULTISPECIES: type I restriction endonuclease [Actinomycetes]WKX12846.1 type I restriction endonuclease [Kutzneria buriramensis]GCB45847.1 type I restriction-modification system [Streptomyces sp. NL15-2K]
MSRRVLPEYEKTEKPLIKQLVGLGWEHLEGASPGEPVTEPGPSGRTSFSQVVYADRFRDAVSRINPSPKRGGTWLTPAQLDRLLALVLGTAPGQGPVDHGVGGNLEVTRLLRNGVNARLLPGWNKGDPELVHLVDWDGENGGLNDLLVVSQFRVERKDARPVIPDLVLFVNGLPWIVIECKAPLTSGGKHSSRAALDDAVGQVCRYASLESPAPVAEFTRFAQVLVGTDRTYAELGTVTSTPEYFTPWRTTEPAPADGCDTDLAVLTAGVLSPDHLLTLVRDFTTERGQGSRTLKVIGRHQQFKAVLRLARRLKARRRAIAAKEDVDQRGGVVWHTQGSGKSLTMAFLVRHIRSDRELRGHKVVVVTDRIDLEKQIQESLAAAEEDVHRADGVDDARAQLAVRVPDVVLVMLQKAQRDETASDGQEENLGTGDGEETRVQVRPANPSSDIVVLVDEAHRGQDSWLHARLRALLPNSVLVGFTGTPIISGARKKTEEVFGPLVDTYTLRDAERDRSVVPVRYEAYDVPLEVVEKGVLDTRFDEQVPADPERRDSVLRTFARRKEVLEAPPVIAHKADHMLRHWAVNALPDRFGAQVVAVSRLAATRYRDALIDARDRLLAQLDALDPAIAHDPTAALGADADLRKLLTVLPHRDVLASIDAAVVIHGEGQKDPEEWRDWTLKSKQDAYIERFKAGLGDPLAAALDPSWDVDPHGPGRPTGLPVTDVFQTGQPPAQEAEDDESGEETGEPFAFLVVQSMLLTGFDAPVEQVLYLDCGLSGVGLLQAVARTNRPYPRKRWGTVVDYIGIGDELARSLHAYEQHHLREVYGYDNVSVDHLRSDFKGTPPTGEGLLLQADAAADRLLSDLHDRVAGFVRNQNLAAFDRHGILTLADEQRREALLDALADPLVRGEFDELARDFLTALGAVLPRPYALTYEQLAGNLGEVQYLARQRYLDGRDEFSPRRYAAKVRRLIADHIRATGVELRVPPVELTAPDFMERVDANPDARARTRYMVSRLRTHITAKIGTDRARYELFSTRLEEIVQRMRQDFEQAADDLARLRGEIVAEPEETGPHLDPLTERPVYRALVRELEQAGAAPLPDGVDLHEVACLITEDIAVMVRPQHFVTQTEARIEARKELRFKVAGHLHMDWDDTADMAAGLLELAVERRDDFRRYQARPRP